MLYIYIFINNIVHNDKTNYKHYTSNSNNNAKFTLGHDCCDICSYWVMSWGWGKETPICEA